MNHAVDHRQTIYREKGDKCLGLFLTSDVVTELMTLMMRLCPGKTFLSFLSLIDLINIQSYFLVLFQETVLHSQNNLLY